MNTRFLRTPQGIAHLASLRRAVQNKNRQLQRLREKVQQLLKEDSIPVDKELSSDIQKGVDQHKAVEEDDFRHIFWEQQVGFHCYSVVWYGHSQDLNFSCLHVKLRKQE